MAEEKFPNNIWVNEERYDKLREAGLADICEEMLSCDKTFYSMPLILRRVWNNIWGRRQPLISLVGNLSYRKNLQLSCKAYAGFKRYLSNRQDCI